MEQESLKKVFTVAKKHRIPISCSVELTEKCNFKCPHCFIKDVGYNELSIADYCRFIDQFKALGGVIEFRNVSFKYPNQDVFSLENFSCRIDCGEHISVVGDNGAGKSTFVKLLLRLYEPTEGAIYYKGKNIREYDFDSYQAVFAPVFQDYVLNAFSIRENLIFDYDERNALIQPSLEKTGMYEKIRDIGLDRPYSKKFFDDGVELSGGEQQRLVISRAYCKNSEVLILDEPTSAIDPLSERRLFEDILGILGEKTSIMISHRMSCSKFANRIFVMEHGKLVEQGTHGELMDLNGLYATMYQRQAQYYM